ncbi:MAG TPA: hypothetical protein VMS38_32715 [Pseudorhodoferax sp.]|jgi:uncharacterized membrane protein YccC|nr:hypothetical protein [Pseudorhodoferax sp.]
MTHATRSALTLLNHRTTQGFYTAILGACLFFATMLLAPAHHTEPLLALSWLCMLLAVALLVGKLGLELALEARR